jgi:hypothetical protein
MTIFPLIIGQNELRTTKKEFISKLKVLTEKNYPLLRPTSVGYDENLKGYARELYDQTFKVWKIPSPGIQLSPFIFTVIQARLQENGESLTLKYFIRFNIWSYILVACFIFTSVYLLFDSIFISGFDLKTSLLILVPYPLFMRVFGSCASDDKEFIKKLST